MLIGTVSATGKIPVITMLKTGEKLYQPICNMVEINIEKKKRPVWPWILLIVIVALLAWAIYDFVIDPDDRVDDNAPVTGLVIPTGNSDRNGQTQTLTV